MGPSPEKSKTQKEGPFSEATLTQKKVQAAFGPGLRKKQIRRRTGGKEGESEKE